MGRRAPSHAPGIGLYGQAIQDGKHIFDALSKQEHYTGALRVIQALDDRQLMSLALTIAADAALTRAERGAGSWRGRCDRHAATERMAGGAQGGIAAPTNQRGPGRR